MERPQSVTKSGPAGRCRIRKMAAEDSGAIVEILKESPEAGRWTVDPTLRNVPGTSQAYVAALEGKVIGVLELRIAGGEAEILNLAVTPGWRRGGVGRSLLAFAIDESRSAAAESIFLEVRESNGPARGLYEGQGFVFAGRRRGYYKDPKEDGLLLSLRLKTG